MMEMMERVNFQLSELCSKMWADPGNYVKTAKGHNFTWGNWYSFEGFVKELPHRIDNREFHRECDDRYTIQQARSSTDLPVISFVSSDFVPTRDWLRDEIGLHEDDELHEKKCKYIPKREDAAIDKARAVYTPSHTVLLLPEPSSVNYLRLWNNVNIGRKVPALNCQQDFSPAESVHKNVRKKYVTSWVNVLVDLTMMEHFGVDFTPSLRYTISEKVDNMLKLFTAQIRRTNQDRLVFDLKEATFRRKSFYACFVCPGVVVASSAFWLRCHQLVDKLFYMPRV